MEEAKLCFPQVGNLSCRKIRDPDSVSMFINVMMSSLSLLILILNLLVIISISHFRQLHTPTNVILLSLAVSDFLVGPFTFFQIVLIDGCWYLGDFMCVVYYILVMIITSASVGNMVLISADRYVAICDPLHYPTRVTLKRIRICVSLCWICSFIYDIFLLKEDLQKPGKFKSCLGECVIHSDFQKQAADLMLTFVFPITIIIVLYLRVFIVALSQVHAMRSHIVAGAQNRSQKVIVKKSEMKAAGTLGIVIFAFLSCLCPYYIVILMDDGILPMASSLVIVNCLFYLNSCLNPLIYGLFYPWFRKSVKIIITLKVLKSGSSDAKIL